MKACSTVLRSVFVLAFTCCDMQADTNKILVLIDLDQSKSGSTESSRLSPALLALRASGGTLKAADGLGRIVVAVRPDTVSKLKKEPFVKSVTNEVPPNCTPVTRVKISYEAGTVPTAEELRAVGLRVVETYEKGSFLIAEPGNGVIDARLISELDRNPKIRFVTPVLHVNAALSDKP